MIKRDKYEEVLLNIGSVVEVENDDIVNINSYLIVGGRIIKFKTMKSWDYYSVPYPEGASKDR